MNRKRSTLLLYLALLFAAFASKGFSLEKETHQVINQEIAIRKINDFSLDRYLKSNLGFKDGVQESLLGFSGKDEKKLEQRVWQWIGGGGITEDEPESIPRHIFNMTRNKNHFHNPLVPWNEAD